MHWLPILAAGVGYLWYRQRQDADAWCYGAGNVCWLYDKAPECEAELRAVRCLLSASKAYRTDAARTAASYLNRSFIRDSYRGQDFLVEHQAVRRNRALIFGSFADGTHMAFELHRPLLDGVRDIWVVRRYAYLDENPAVCCG